MSGARRKSKNPQKWEESPDHIHNSSESKISDCQIYKEANYSIHDKSDAKLNTNKIDIPKNENYSSMPTTSKHESDYCLTDNEEVVLRKTRGNNEYEMMVIDVFQGARQSLAAECKACSVNFKDWISTVSHIRSHRLVFIPSCSRDIGNYYRNQSVSCSLCQKVCQNLSVLAFHSHTEHNIAKGPFICPFCGREFPSNLYLQAHIDIKDVSMKCPVCSATFIQEYKLYDHLSDCLPTFHPHLKSLTCHVCREKISMESLADHMIVHSFQGHEVRQSVPRKMTSSTSDIEDCIFLCEICDRRFTGFDVFRKHLYDHSETRMYCPLCLLKGFERMDYIVRHLMLRCPRRCPEQIEFGAVMAQFGKEHSLNFLQIIREIGHIHSLRETLHIWTNIPLVHELLMSVNSLRREDITGVSFPTDVELLLWLSEFEKEMQKPRSGDWFSYDKKDRAYQLFSSGYIPNTQITMTSTTIRDKNNANAEEILRQKPSAAEIRKTCPGIIFFQDVTAERLKSLYDEVLLTLERDFVNEYIERGTATPEDLLRLEWEAQLLRTKKPYYIPHIEEKKTFSPLLKWKITKKEASSLDIDANALKRIKIELEEQNENSHCSQQLSSVDKLKLISLLEEAKYC